MKRRFSIALVAGARPNFMKVAPEETTALGVPCVTIRENTERPVTVDVGTNYLAGTKPEAILAISRDILSGKMKRGTIPPLWDGQAAERIADILIEKFS